MCGIIKLNPAYIDDKIIKMTPILMYFGTYWKADGFFCRFARAKGVLLHHRVIFCVPSRDSSFEPCSRDRSVLAHLYALNLKPTDTDYLSLKFY